MLLPFVHAGLIATFLNPTSEPRGDGFAFCRCWRDSDLRETKMKPYIAMNTGAALEHEDVPAKIDTICGGAHSVFDVTAYRELGAWLQANRRAAPHNPFTMAYYSAQATEIERAAQPTQVASAWILDYGCGSGVTLSYLHQRRGVPSSSLHCIELYDMVPAESKSDFNLHILQDPVADLHTLAHGILQSSFDVVASFAVFHHIPDTNVRAGVLASIFAMTKPGCVFLLSDWDSMGTLRLDMWYDVAHHLLWLLMGSGGPSTKASLAIGTRYEGVTGWIGLAGQPGFQPDSVLSTAPHDIQKSPLGGFTQAFRRPTSFDSGAWTEHKHTTFKDERRNATSLHSGARSRFNRSAADAARPEPRAIAMVRGFLF